MNAYLLAKIVKEELQSSVNDALQAQLGKNVRKGPSKTQIEVKNKKKNAMTDLRDHNVDLETLDWFKIRLWFRSNKFMEIKQIRAYNFQTLVGNGGGYIGLFLGCTIIELPSMISSAYAWMQRNVCPYHWVK